MQRTDHLIDSLRSAHAMERVTRDTAGFLVKRMSGHPDLVDRYRLHLADSRGQTFRLEQGLLICDAESSPLKDAAARAAGWAAAVGATFAEAEPIKHVLNAYSYAHFEIASYKSLIVAAEHCERSEIVKMSRQSLDEEQSMAEWLQDFLPEVTRRYLSTSRSDSTQFKL